MIEGGGLHGLDLVKKGLVRLKANGLKTLVYVDPDVDGFIAAYFIIHALKGLGIEYSIYINPLRKHGFFLDPEEIGGKYNVINGDFHIETDILRELVSRGSTVLSLDHHELTDKDLVFFRNGQEVGVTINNQYPFENPENRYESGAGIVRDVFASVLGGKFKSEEFNALGAITLLSDIRNIENKHARRQLELLYNHPYKGEIKRLAEGVLDGKRVYSFGKPRMERGFVDYTFVPSINAMIRLGQEKEALAFILGEGRFPSQDRPQDRQKRVLKYLEKQMVEVQMNRLTVIRLPGEGNFSNFLGLVCSKAVETTGRSVLGFSTDERGTVNRASFRGQIENVPYRTELSRIMDAAGHEIAFGVRDFKPTPELFKAADSIIQKIEFGKKTWNRVLEVKNLEKMNNSGELRALAEENNFLLSPNMVRLRYTGGQARIEREGEKFRKWKIGSLEVLQFVGTLHVKDIENLLIIPGTEKGMLQLTVDAIFEP